MGRPATIEELQGARVAESPEDKSYDTDKDYEPSTPGRRLKIQAKRAGREMAKKAVDTGNPVDAALGSVASGIGEGALTMATGAPLAAAGGLAGATRAGAGMAAGAGYRLLTGRSDVGETPDEALRAGARVSKSIQSKGYQPKTEAGRLSSELMAAPFELASEYGGKVLGALTEPAGPKAEAAGRTIGEVAPAAAAAAFGLRKPTGVRPGVTPGAPAPSAAVISQAQQLATSIGRNYNQMPTALKQRIIDLVQESTASGTTLDPAAIRRKLDMEELPVPIEKATKGQYTRDPGQLKMESTLQFSESGAPIRNVMMDQDAALIANIDYLKGKTGGATLDERQIGSSLADSMERARKRSLDHVDSEYEKVRQSKEINDPVSPKGIVDWVSKNGAAAISVPEIKSLADALKKFGAVGTSKAGKAKAGRDLTIGEMEEIRKLAVSLRGTPGTPASHYMGEAISAIDRSLERAGGNLYKEARKARTEHALAFEEPDSVYQITAKKSRTDREVALEDVWKKTVIGNDVDGLAQVKDRLTKDPDPKVRAQGEKTWKDLQAYTLDYLKREASGSITKNERGEPQFSATNYAKALRSIGPGNLELIFGKDMSTRLKKIQDVAADLKTNPASAGGSDTTPRLLRMIESVGNVLDLVPFVGKATSDVVTGAARGVKKLRDMGKSGRLVDEALSYTPTPRYNLEQQLKESKRTKTAGALSVPVTATTVEEEEKRKQP